MPGKQFESVPCPNGCSLRDNDLMKGKDNLHGKPGEFSVVQCATCGLIRTNPRPTPEVIGRYYPTTYAPFLKTKVLHKSRSRAALSWAATKLWKLGLDPYARLVRGVRKGNALEIGCASGSFLRGLQKRGFSVAGIEQSAQAVASARAAGLNVFHGTIEDASPPFDAPVDVAFAFHTVEHFHNPLDALSKLRGWMKSNGLFVCSMPNAESVLFSRMRSCWYDLDLPRHLFHYTPQTISELLCKAGFAVERISAQPTLNSWMGSLGLVCKTSNRQTHNRKRLQKLFLTFPNARGVWKAPFLPVAYILKLLRQTGRMTIWARAI